MAYNENFSFVQYSSLQCVPFTVSISRCYTNTLYINITENLLSDRSEIKSSFDQNIHVLNSKNKQIQIVLSLR